MKFVPKTEKEIAEQGLWPAGEYSFEIVDARDDISKVKADGTGGNEMIVLTVNVYNDDGGSRVIFDYLLESTAAKLRRCAAVCGLLDQYESGVLMAQDFIGKTGTLKLRIVKDKTNAYPDKNGISDYVVKSNGTYTAPPSDFPGDMPTSEPMPWDA